LRVFIFDFHEVEDNDKCTMAKQARSIQESQNNLACQFVFSGHWSFYSFCSTYSDNHGKTTSPPIQEKEVIRKPTCTSDELLKYLTENSFVRNPSEFDRLAAEFLVEQTGGNEFLATQAVTHLLQHSGPWTNNVEQVLDALIDDFTIRGELAKRLNSLDAAPRSMLWSLLRFHHLSRPMADAETEALWLAGFARREEMGSGNYRVRVASPLIDTILRRSFHDEKPGSIALPEHVCFDHGVLATAAFRKVSEIENLLRNIFVTVCYSKHGDDWHQVLDDLSTTSFEEAENREIGELIDSKLKAFFPNNAISVKEEIKSPKPSGSPKKQKLRETTKNWQDRVTKQDSTDLAQNNLMQFFTTGDLMNALLHKKHGLSGDGKLFDKHDLISSISNFNQIRSAVAHNQAMKICTMTRLDDLHRKFVAWITVFADRDQQE